MAYVTLPPETVLRAIEGYEDVLTPVVKAEEAFYRQHDRCTRCGGLRHKEFLANHAFADPSSLVARAVLRCAGCGSLYDPHAGLFVEMGNPAKVPSDPRILKPNGE